MMNKQMKNVYFAGPISVSPQQATDEKKRFLEQYYRVFMEENVNVHSPHLMYRFLTDVPDNDGKGSPPEDYALRSCLNFIRATDLDAVVMLTDEDEESGGMTKERELAEELDIPIYNYPYFTQDGETLSVNGATEQELRSLLRGI